MTRMFLQIASNEWEQKHRVSDTYYENSDYTNFIKITWNSTKNWQKTEKVQKDKKLVVQKNRQKIQYKTVLNKIMATYEKCIKCNFVAPLMVKF